MKRAWGLGFYPRPHALFMLLHTATNKYNNIKIKQNKNKYKIKIIK